MLIALTTVWLVGLVVSYADARLPPKFLKATNNIGKIYNGRHSYAVVPPQFVVQASLARKEVHVPPGRGRPKRRLIGRRPPPVPQPEFASSNYHDYSPVPAASTKYPRLRKAPKVRRKPRPPPREPPDYYEQEIEDEEDFGEYDYEDKHHEKPHKGYDDRPAKRGYSSSTPKSSFEDSRPNGPKYSESRYKGRYEADDEEFVAQHSEMYASGYPPGKAKARPPRQRGEDMDHHYPPPPGRKSRPPSKGYKGPSRPSSKLYSASVSPPRRPQRPKDEDRYQFEDEEEEEDVTPRPRYKKRPKLPEEEIYDEPPRYKDHEKDNEQEKDIVTGYSRPGGVIREEFEFNPDNFYHDRKYEPKQKSKRGTEDKESDGIGRPKQRRPLESEPEHRPFRPSEARTEEHRVDDHRGDGRKETTERRKKEKPRIKQEEHLQLEEPRSPADRSKWSIPFHPESEDDEAWEQENEQKRKPSKKPENGLHTKSKKQEDKPVIEYETSHTNWPLVVQGLNNWKDAPHIQGLTNWKDAPHIQGLTNWKDAQQPPFADPHAHDFFNTWQQNFQVPQWPNLDEQLGNFPDSVHSTFKWVEPTNQTPLHPTTSPMSFRTTTSSPPIVVPPVDYASRAIGSQANNEPRKKKSSKRPKDRTSAEASEVVAQRVVGGTLQLNGGFKPEPSKNEGWVNPVFRSSVKTPGRTPQQQYTVEMFKSVEPAKPFQGDIVYGSRISDSKSKKIEPDIGYQSGMETIDDDIGGWQVY